MARCYDAQRPKLCDRSGRTGIVSTQNANPQGSLERVVRAVVLPYWQWSLRYKHRHPQGVVLFPVGKPERFTVYRSHATIEKAMASAESLNRTHRGLLSPLGIPEITFEAVRFHRPNE